MHMWLTEAQLDGMALQLLLLWLQIGSAQG